MSSSRALPSVVLVVLLAASASARAPQKWTVAEAAKLRDAGSDAAILTAVRSQNERALSPVVIKVIDQRWFLGKESGVVRQTITGPCANRLRDFLAANPAHTEAFVLDAQGAVVCANARTTIYWYGEELRWQRAFGNAVFSDGQGLLAVPIVDEAKVIGVITSRVKR